MSLDFTPTKFGAQQQAAAKPAAADRPQAEFWLNLGYTTDMQNQETGEYLFVSLPQGVPLDTQELADTNVRSNELAAIRGAQNELHAQLMEYVSNMEPGESKIIKLEVQVRRRKAAVEPIDPKNNPLIKQLSFS